MQIELTMLPRQEPIARMTEANAASVALINGNKVLLIQRAFEPLKGLWTFPGGRREPGENIEDTAIRELFEELGLVVSGLEPVMNMPIGGGFQLQIFATRMFAGAIVASAEIADRRWVQAGGLAGLAVTEGLDNVIARSFAAVAV
jgi:8-oxo-dGTP diphosphatase